MVSKRRTSRRTSRRSSRRKRPVHANASTMYEVVELSPGRATDGRTIYLGHSLSRARAAFEDFLGGAMLLKNGRVVNERGSESEDRRGLGYMQGRGAS